MNRLSSIVLAMTTISVIAGCGGGGGGSNPPPAVTNYGSGQQSFAIYAELQNSDAWSQATLSGNAAPGTWEYDCDPTTDPDGCLTQFAQVAAGTSGELIFHTDALPATWIASANADVNCSSGANSGPESVGNDGSIYVICGSTPNTGATVSPSSCYTETFPGTNDPPRTNCPSTVTITTTSSPFPTGYALAVAAYSDTASTLEQTNIAASSSTSITVPLPNDYGDIVFLVQDPNNNSNVVASALFVHNSFSIIH